MSAAPPTLSGALIDCACTLNQAALRITGKQTLSPAQVHKLRVTCKELRGLWQLVRGLREKQANRGNQRLGAASRSLGTARDQHVMVETLATLIRQSKRKSEKQALEAAHQCLFASEEKPSPLPTPDDLKETFKEDLEAWRSLKLDGEDQALVDIGLRRSWRKIRNRILQALDSDRLEDWHALRKWVKYLGYQLAWLEQCGLDSPLPTRQMQDFGRDLGGLHDLHVLINHVRDHTDSFPDPEAAAFCKHLLRRHEAQRLEHCALAAVHLTQIKPGRLSRQILAQLPSS